LSAQGVKRHGEDQLGAVAAVVGQGGAGQRQLAHLDQGIRTPLRRGALVAFRPRVGVRPRPRARLGVRIRAGLRIGPRVGPWVWLLPGRLGP
jgi:hypothetical protein